MASLGHGFYATHPGEVVNDELEARGISQRKFAELVGMSPTALNEILKGHRAITPATALIFEAALDIPADALVKLQAKYNMQQARKDPTLIDRIKRIGQVAAL
jgi:addiction module HigA family antidote